MIAGNLVATTSADGTVALVGKQGKTWRFVLEIRNPDGLARDLTNWTIRGQIRRTHEALDVRGDRHIVGAGATGVWVERDSDIAQWSGSAWEFTARREGMCCYVRNEDALYFFVTSWVECRNFLGLGIGHSPGFAGLTLSGLTSGSVPFDGLECKW